MARLITEAFEGGHLYRFGNNLGMNGNVTNVTVASQGILMDGLRCMRMGGFDGVIDMPLLCYSGNPTLGVAPGTLVSRDEIYIGFFFMASDPDNITNPIVGGTVFEVMHRIVSVWSGGVGICTLRIDALNGVKLQLMNGAFYYTDAAFSFAGTVDTVPLATATTAQPLSANTLYHIQLHVKLAGALSVVEVKLDDVLCLSYTGPLNGAMPTMDRIIWYSAGTSYAQALGEQWIDDIVVNDVTAAACVRDATWPGVLRFAVQNVTGPGFYSQFTPVGDAPNFATVDDLPHDGDTTYNYALSVNSGFKDSFPTSPNGLNALAVTYTGWFQEVIARKSGGTSQIKLGVRRAGVDYIQPVGQNVGISYDVYDNRLCNDPSSLVSWTSAGLDATEIVYEIV